jgi:hypothetical protein
MRTDTLRNYRSRAHTHPPYPPVARERAPGKAFCACALAPEESFVLRLKAKPSTTPAEVRLRRLLKLALRAFAFEAVAVKGETP